MDGQCFMVNKYRYEIDEKNGILIFDLENPFLDGSPFFYQPDYPNGSQFLDSEDAHRWAILKIEEMSNPLAPFAPLGLGLSPIQKPSIQEQFDMIQNAQIDRRPYPSWSMNPITGNWNAPIEKPDDGKEYTWNEENGEWV